MKNSFANTIEIVAAFESDKLSRSILLAVIELDRCVSDDNLDKRTESFRVMWSTSHYVKLQPQRNLHQPRLGRPRASRVYTWATFEQALGRRRFFDVKNY